MLSPSVRELLEVREDHDHPEVDRERIDRLQHVVGEEPVEEVLLRVRRVLGRVSRDEPLVHRVPLGALHDVPLLHRSAIPVDEGVRQDLEEPGLHVGAALELVEEAVGAEEGVLDEVLCVTFVLRQPQGGRVERVDVLQRELLELVAGQVVLAEVEHTEVWISLADCFIPDAFEPLPIQLLEG